MPRLAYLFWMCIIAVAAFGLYMVKYRVLEIQKEIAATQRALEQEHENMHIISAEWAYLNRPERLQELAQKYLKLQPMQGVQLGDLNTVPYQGEAVAAANADNVKPRVNTSAIPNVVPAVALQGAE